MAVNSKPRETVVVAQRMSLVRRAKLELIQHERGFEHLSDVLHESNDLYIDAFDRGELPDRAA